MTNRRNQWTTARAVSFILAIVPVILFLLVVANLVWTSLPADGGMGMVERVSWAPSLGIEYHLGVDGLGACLPTA